jgi:hypothetical protein
MGLYKGTHKKIRRYIIMELCVNQGFAPLSQDEMMAVDGGVDWGAVLGGAGLVVACIAVVVTAPVSVPAIAAGALVVASGVGGYAVGTGLVS